MYSSRGEGKRNIKMDRSANEIEMHKICVYIGGLVLFFLNTCKVKFIN